ncbi:hypothetical protein ACFRQM_48310 [Streptomyces sp. NPDC056831]|uniref:hypothetical protein n=1 Tax=Streptomyces sp. NPDC056831 TaxID=3345954 RepID=UPI00367D3745
MTAGLREAMDDVRRSVHRLARRGRARLRPVPARPDRHLQPYGRRCAAWTPADATLAHSALQALGEPTVPAGVRQAVRTAPPPVEPPADPALRAVVVDLAASTHAIGELMLEVTPAYLSAPAADFLAPLCEEIGEELEHGLAARRYAMSGDRRALHGTVL